MVTVNNGVEQKLYEADAGTVPVFTYGLGASIRLHDHVDLTTQYLGVLCFMGEQGFTRAGGERFFEDMGNYNLAKVFFGLSFRL